jgi:S-DNA-T family DNA segregation ATPase FtsK/SpoIIIE
VCLEVHTFAKKIVSMPSIKSRAPNSSKGFSKALGLCLLTITLVLSLGAYHPEDPSFSSFSTTWRAPQNVLGYLGSWVSDILFQVFGWSAWLIPALVATALVRWLASETPRQPILLGKRWWAALTLSLSAICLLTELINFENALQSFPPQGVLGILLGSITKPFFGVVGSYLFSLGLIWAFCLVWWEELPEIFIEACLRAYSRLSANSEKLPKIAFRSHFFQNLMNSAVNSLKVFQKNPISQKIKDEPKIAAEPEKLVSPVQLDFTQPIIRQHSNKSETEPKRASAVSANKTSGPTNWTLPPLSLLELSKKKIKGPSHDQLLETARKLTHALKSFEVDGEVVEITPGPIITMYEFQPAPGVRIQKIISTSTDLAMALGAPSVRIVAPIPGKSVAGIEVPNLDKEDILLRDVYDQTQEKAKAMRLPLVLGKDGEGKPMCEDLSRMPHLLIGGATSMGKSVLVNSLLTSLLCRFTPESLRLVIVDPKLVEFKAFEDIPHLLLPIVNDPQDASQALKWAVAETKRRYVVMQKYSAKNLEAYNQKITSPEFKPLDSEIPEKFPYIVIIIDELAELMLTAKKDVEQSIVRLTQLARAAGLHLIMSTQRPSADVVTGLIKSNCPSRAALRVASSSDSRIILDCTGAEQLLGRGDMFFTNTGPMGLRRLQSCFVSDPEIEKVCSFWRDQGEPEYKDEILAPEPDALDLLNSDTEGVDSLYSDVLGFAREKGKISTSLIQRRFQIGYSRAARIMEQLEARGIVGEQQAAGKPRDVIA